MAKRLQHRGGTTSQHSSFTGAVREVTVDTDKNTLVVHDGATAGGHPLATATNFKSTGIDDNATSTAITIDSSERVGIQTTNPVSELDVYGTSRAESFQLHKGTSSLIGATLSLSNISGDANSNDLTITAGQSTNSIALRSAIAVDNFTYNSGAYRRRLRIAQNGDVSFYEDTGTTAKMLWDASAEKLGIGITSPSAQLHIYNATNNNDTRIAVTGSTTSASEDMLGLLIDNGRHGANSKIRLGAETTGGVQRDFDIINLPNDNLLRLDGNTEINGGSSTGTLRIRDFGGTSARTVGRIQFLGEFSAPADGNRVFAQIEGQKENSTGGATDGRLVFMTNSGVSSSGLPVEVARFDSNGKLGIGTSSPAQTLSIIGNAQIENTSASGNAWYYAKNADKTYLMGVRGSSGDALSFYDATTDVERMQIASSGDVTFNNDGADADFQIKDDNNSNLFYAHGSASLPYVQTSGVHMHDSDNEGGLSRHQTVTGEVTAPASGTTIELVQVGHTNICNVSIIAKQTTNSGGVAYRTVGAFIGNGTGGTVTESYLGGAVTDINIFYQNGGSNAYTINATITYTGTAPTIYFTVDGKASQNFEKLV